MLSAFVIMLTVLANTIPIPNTSAEPFQSEETIQFTLNPTITINITGGDLRIESLSPGDTKDSNIITVNASSNAAGGYNVYGSVGSSTITNTNLTQKNGTNTFTSINTTTPLSNFSDNNWGYAYSTDSGSTWISGDVGSATAGYNGLPLYNSADTAAGTLLASTTSPINSSFQFKIAAKASTTQIAGEYTNVINFIGVTNPDPEPPVYMQNATLADCGKTMIDKRDGSRYTTGLINNQCYMTRNLRIIGEVSASLSNFSHSSSFTTNYWDGVGCEPQSVIGQTIEDGAYYNYCAASAGTVDPWIADDASEDICPSGWRLPTANDFNAFPSSGIRNVWGSISAGYYSCWDGDGCYSQDYASHYWSATRAYDNDATQQVLYDAPGMGDWYFVEPYEKTEGYSIRCVLSS